MGHRDYDYRIDPHDGLVMPRTVVSLRIGDVKNARYERGRRRHLEFTPHYLPHTIIATMMRERAIKQGDAVSTCPEYLRLGCGTTAVDVEARMQAWRRARMAEDRRRGQTAAEKAALAHMGGYDIGDRLDYRTGEYVAVDGVYYWAVDEVRYDYRHECFVARYMDKPPAYLSRQFGAWAIRTWTVQAGRGQRDLQYAEWLAWFECAHWDDMIASLESSGDGAPPSRILRGPPPIIGFYPDSWGPGPRSIRRADDAQAMPNTSG